VRGFLSQPPDHHVLQANDSGGLSVEEIVDTDINLYSKATIGSDGVLTPSG
jgi:hypothetical protein